MFSMDASIKELMVREHGKIFALLGKFRFELDHLRDTKAALKAYKKFNTFHKKHIYVEEKIIIKYNKQISSLGIAKAILKQHKEIKKTSQKILIQAKKAKENIPDKLYEEAAKLQKYLIAHVILEETKFYPFLDGEMKEADKIRLINKITKSLQ